MSYKERFDHDIVLRDQYKDLLENMPDFDEKRDYLVLVEDGEGTGFLELVAGFDEEVYQDRDRFIEIMEIAHERADGYGTTRKGEPHGVALLRNLRHVSYCY